MNKGLFTILIIFISIFISSCSKNDVYYEENDFPVEEESSYLLIDLKGAVKFPSIYTVKKGTSLYALIDLSGGLTYDADVSNINLAFILTENQMIKIPFKKESVPDNNDLININTASAKELLTLPGIGSSKVENIIRYRNTVGSFKTIEDIKNVNGIGEELFKKIKNYICV